jgi:signal peptidase I
MSPLLAAAAVAVTATVTLAVIRVRRTIVTITVEGMSMSPVYVDGDRVLISRRIAAPVARNQVVVLEPPHPSSGRSGPPQSGQLSRRNWYIKRVVAVAGDPVPAVVRVRQGLADDAIVGPGEIVVLGEHPRSEDSKQWGCLPADRVLGVVLRKL